MCDNFKLLRKLFLLPKNKNENNDFILTNFQCKSIIKKKFVRTDF